jgi:hypothetical protein
MAHHPYDMWIHHWLEAYTDMAIHVITRHQELSNHVFTHVLFIIGFILYQSTSTPNNMAPFFDENPTPMNGRDLMGSSSNRSNDPSTIFIIESPSNPTHDNPDSTLC